MPARPTPQNAVPNASGGMPRIQWKTPMELLAPAGGWEQLEYAARFGADAVYLACDRFGMRARACNFPLGEIPRVVAFCHEHGMAVHVTCNIVMHQDDLDALPHYLAALDKAGVDALIVGDLGALRLAREHAPRCALHVSTQASVSNAVAACTWYELGARRIVCAREMSIDAIAQMHAQLPDDLELEAFVHGAMCMAYSGRCLISDYLTGRSALEGNCAQSCRWKYALVEELRPGEYHPIEEDGRGSFIMNAQDLNMLSHLDELASAGVDSIKIEGRNKKAYYVATTVNAYRRVLDGADAGEVAGELERISHRPYSTGFFFGPAHQTPQSDEYTHGWEWAAQVLSCAPHTRGGFHVTLRCRNRFSPEQRLELLSPGRPVHTVHLAQLEFMPTREGGLPYPVELANRTNEDYRAVSDTELHPGDILRAERM